MVKNEWIGAQDLNFPSNNSSVSAIRTRSSAYSGILDKSSSTMMNVQRAENWALMHLYSQHWKPNCPPFTFVVASSYVVFITDTIRSVVWFNWSWIFNNFLLNIIQSFKLNIIQSFKLKWFVWFVQPGEVLSIIDKPSSEESSWWRGKKKFEVGPNSLEI